ncbi:hypothetical protein ACG1VR_16065 [Cedecea davisae]|uniref:hypothetical protein n=1 Tax=Cedecea davisae TaxID=158484 RepID=UPI00376EFDCD
MENELNQNQSSKEQVNVCHKIYECFKSLDGASNFKIDPETSGDDGDLSFSFEQSKTVFKVEVLSTEYFKLIRIINAFDFTATKSIEEMNLLGRANQFNAYAVGIKALVYVKKVGYVDFCADILSANGDVNFNDLNLSLVLLRSAPMNFLAVTKD